MLRSAAIRDLKNCIAEARAVGSVRLFSFRHEFPTEWARFKSIQIEGDTTVAELKLNFREEHYPYWSKGRLGRVQRADLLAKTTNDVDVTFLDGGGTITLDSPRVLFNNIRGCQLPDDALAAPTGEYRLQFSDNSMEELWLAVTWGTA